MGVRPEEMQEVDHVVDVVVEVETVGRGRDHPTVLPVGDIHLVVGQQRLDGAAQQRRDMSRQRRHDPYLRVVALGIPLDVQPELGRASCRERVYQYVYISVVAVKLKNKNKSTNRK